MVGMGGTQGTPKLQWMFKTNKQLITKTILKSTKQNIQLL